MSNPKLTVSGVGPQPKVYDLAGQTVIGRSVKAEVQIDGDLVSRQHCRVFQEDGRWHFEDLGSRNGTLLNGQRAQNGTLRSGDVLMIGYAKLLFEHDEPVESSVEVSFVEAPSSIQSALFAEGDEEKSGATVALSYKDLVVLNQRITTISRVGQHLATLLDRDALLREVMGTLFELYPQADRGCVVLRQHDESFRVAAVESRKGPGQTMSVMQVSTALIGLVRRERKAVLSADTGQDDRFADRQSMVGSAGRSIMCAPLQREQEFLGVIYLDTESLRQPFTPNDLNLLQGIAGPVAISLKNAELVESIEQETQLRTSLSRYLSPNVVQQIGEGTLKPNLGGDQAEGTIMFSDIVGFTAMSESLSAKDVVARLNRYFTTMLEAIFGWDGTVDKFGGDAIMAVWGAPVPNAEHAPMAVAGSLEMQVRLFDLNLALEAAGETLIRMAVGLNSGRFVAGNIGGNERIEWTVIGDAVNTAQRVESQGFRGCVLVSQSTFEQLGAAGAYSFAPVHVKNRAEPVRIYSVRTLNVQGRTVAAVPGTLTTAAGAVRAILTKVVEKAGVKRVTVHAAGDVSSGQSVEFSADLPERPEGMRLEGRIVSSSPLEEPGGRSLDLELTKADMEATRLLDAAGAAKAPLELDAIER